MALSPQLYHVVSKHEMQAFISRCMRSVGTSVNHADVLAECLVLADCRGHYSHGLNRLDLYVNDIKNKVCESSGEPVILKESPATALIDGKNLLGPVIGKYAMEVAIKKAQAVGVGWVAVRGSNHFGIAAYYSMMAMEKGLMGMSFTNSSPLVTVSGGKRPFVGTNPISLAAPGEKSNFVLDMATSVVAYGKVEIRDRRGEEIPDNWAIDSTGKCTRTPSEATALLPLGGVAETSGYKGTGLGFLVEIFSGLLSGSSCAPNIRNWKDNEKIANLGQCFAAVNPSFFEDGFPQRVDQLVSDIKNEEPGEGTQEILVAGEPEERHMKLCQKLGGIPYHPNQIEHANQVAQALSVSPPPTVKSVHLDM